MNEWIELEYAGAWLLAHDREQKFGIKTMYKFLNSFRNTENYNGTYTIIVA